MYKSSISATDVQSPLQYEKRISEDTDVYSIVQTDAVVFSVSVSPAATAFTYLYQVGYTAVAYDDVPLETLGGESVDAFTTACMELWLCSDGEYRPYEGRLYAELPAAYITTLNNEHYNTYGLFYTRN